MIGCFFLDPDLEPGAPKLTGETLPVPIPSGPLPQGRGEGKGVTAKMRIPTIATPRLTLRAFTEKDVEPLHRILSGRDVLRYFPRTDPPPPDRVQKMVSGLLKHWEKYGYGLWAVESRSTRELMGRSGLQYLPETEEIEVDFLLGKAFWGKGFATEAGRASLRHGFEELGLESVVGIVHPENKASQRVLEKLGMKFMEQTRYFGMDCYRYAIERPGYARASASWEGDFSPDTPPL